MKDVKEAETGESVGVTTTDKLFIERGHVLCSGAEPNVTNELKARVFWMSKKALGEGERLVLRLATQETDCTVKVGNRINSSTLEILGPGQLQNNEVGETTIETDKHMVYEDFNDIPELGRFVLIRGHDVVAGGIVT